jgi:outer membrane biosynthesis protein TonB
MFGKGAQEQAPKVLRIGIVQDGKVVHERLIKQRQSVTIGESARNTFVFPSKSLPKRFTLFLAKGDTYQLVVSKEMQGKVARRGLPAIDLDQIRAGEGGSKKGDTWVLPLKDGTRGRVALDNLTVLFQFVPAPPESVRMANRQDFRPKLLDEDDPVFVGTMSVFMALAAVLMIYVWNTDPVESVSLAEFQDRFVEMVLDAAEKEKEEQTIEETSDEGEKVKEEEETPEEKEPERKPKTKDEKEAQEAARLEKKKEDVIAKSKLLAAIIGTRGETKADGSVEDLFASTDGNISNLEEALQHVSGVQEATSEALGVKSGRKGGREDAQIRDMARGSGGSGKVDEGPKNEVKGKAKLKGIDSGGSEHEDGIKSVVRKKKSQVQYCYEQSLKLNPNIGGRLEIEVNIQGGRVTSAKVVQNATGDSSIEGCVVSKVRRWRFPPEVSATIRLPFALSAG